jgi:hypothetical protein
MKSYADSRPASIERGASAHGPRPAEVSPGVRSFLRDSVLKRLAVAAIVFAVAGAFGANARAAQAGKAAESGASREGLLMADHAFANAAMKGDKTTAEMLLGPNFTWTNRDGKTWTRAQALGAWKTLGATAANENGFDARVYGRVGVVTGMGRDGNKDVRFGRIWIKGKAGWKATIYQANPVLPAEAPAAPAAAEKGPATCINPCKEVPYEPKTAAVHSVVASWQALETANFGHDVDGWAAHVSDDFMLIRPNGKLLDKAFRMATIRHQKANSIVVHVPTAQWVHVRMFGDTAVMTAHHQLFNGTPYHATRVWILRDGVWKLALSQQTIIK